MLNISEAAKNEFGKKSSTKTVSITIKTSKKTINIAFFKNMNANSYSFFYLY